MYLSSDGVIVERRTKNAALLLLSSTVTSEGEEVISLKKTYLSDSRFRKVVSGSNLSPRRTDQLPRQGRCHRQQRYSRETVCRILAF